MPKQSRMKKLPLAPVRELLNAIFERLCKLETNAADVTDLRCEMSAHLHSEMQQLNGRIGCDFQDQDDEIEKISRRLQSVEDKLKAKQIGEETNVTLTARVKELQRQLTDANAEISRWKDSEFLNASAFDAERAQWRAQVENVRKERDAETERADRAEAELTGVRLALAAERSRVRTIWDIITLKRSK